MGMNHERSEATRPSLLRRVRDWGDQASWDEFYKLYAPLIRRLALRSELSQAEADDVVQETFVVVAKKMKDFNYDPAAGSFRGWVLNTARWRITDQFRKRKKLPGAGPKRDRTGSRTGTIERVPDQGEATRHEASNAHWQAELLAKAVEKVKGQVSAKQFQIYDLNVAKQWPAAKVAEFLNVGSGRIYLAKFRVGRLIAKEVKALAKASH